MKALAGRSKSTPEMCGKLSFPSFFFYLSHILASRTVACLRMKSTTEENGQAQYEVHLTISSHLSTDPFPSQSIIKALSRLLNILSF